MPFDVVVAASGYESRATFVAKVSNTGTAKHRIAFGFSDRANLARQRNDKTFKRLGFRSIASDGHTGETIKEELKNVIRRTAGDRAVVLVDYSSMTKTWYAAVLRLLASADLGKREIHVYFAYSCSKFSRPSQSTPNKYMGPVPGFCHLDLPDRKSALVLGLGYETERASGLVEYVEPAQTFGFYTDPAIDRSFSATVRKNNVQLLARLGEGRVFKYPMADLRTTAALLSSLCFGLIKDHRVILAPLGPKPFALLCFLLATGRQEFDVWRVSAGEHGHASDRPPSGDIIIARTTFVAE